MFFHYVVKPIFEWMHIRNPDIYNPPHTQTPRIFKSSTVFTSLSNKLKCAPDIFPGHNFFLLNTTSWTILDVLAAFWIPLCIYKCNVTCKMVLGSVSGTFKHIFCIIHKHIHIFRIFAIPGIFRALKYSKAWGYLDPCQTYCSVFGK